MNGAGRIALYSGVIVLGAVAGALVPLYAGGGVTRRVTFLAFAAGVMFGATFFHMAPEAFHSGGYPAFSWVPVGFLFLFVLERYVLVHVCEEPPDCAEHTHGKSLGIAAFFGLAFHTLFDGVALGASASEGVGFTVFLAILAHKIPSALSLATILRTEGRSRGNILASAVLYGLMVPLGAVLYAVLHALVPFKTFAPMALAFSAGTFLYIAVSDLLPHVNRHGPEGRLRHLVGMVGGLALMFALTFVTGHEHAF